MSFIVSYNGQFKNYQLPDLSHYDRVQHIYKEAPIKDVKDHDEFSGKFLNKSDFSNKKNIIEQYSKLDDSYNKEKISHYARDIMSSPIHFHYIDECFQDIYNSMLKYNYRHFPILNRKEVLVGIISDRDILNCMNKEDFQTISLDQIMTPKVLTARLNARIQDIAKLMLHNRINCLPVIDFQNVLTGIITQSDILKFVIKYKDLTTYA